MKTVLKLALILAGFVLTTMISAQHLGGPVPVRHDSVVHDTILIRHDTTYVVDTTSVYVQREALYYDYYDYYCGDRFWNSFDCHAYLFRPSYVYIPRYRVLPTFRDRRPYMNPPRTFPPRPTGREPIQRGPIMGDRKAPTPLPVPPPLRPPPPPPPPRPISRPMAPPHRP